MTGIRYIGILILFLALPILVCSQRARPDPNDCRGAILICGDTELGLTPNGVGYNEFEDPGNPTPTCLDFGSFAQAWFKVEVGSDGTFEFVIEPDDGVADYDFAVFGPTTDCSNLGAAIRCSSTNPQAANVPAATGLNATSTDVEEGPGGNGDGFLRQLDVLAGETYYIVVALAVGEGGFSINTGGTTTFPQAAFANDVPDIMECDDDDGSRDGFKTFDFTSLNDDILNGQMNAVVSFYTSLNDANIGNNPISFPFTNTTNPQEIFYRVERTDSECADFNQFEVTVDDSRIDTEADEIIICSTQASENFDLISIIDQLVPNSNLFNITYHNSLNDAIIGSNARVEMVTVTPIPQSIYIKVTDPIGALCDAVISVPLRLMNPPVITIPADLFVCDDDFDGFVTTNLNVQTTEILNGLDPSDHNVRYYANAADRDTGMNSVTNFRNTINPQTLFTRVTQISTGCTSDVEFQLLVTTKPTLAIQEPKILCLNAVDPMPLTVETGFDLYEWSTGESGASLNEILIGTPGDYTVTVTNRSGCQSSLTMTVNASDIAVLDSIDVTDFQRGNNSVTINATGPGDYEFAVDNDVFQDSPDFTGLASGYHNLQVRDKNGCGVYSSQFAILDFQTFFTPNADSYNDLWTLDALSDFPEARLLIYDRYGKLLKQLSPDSSGWDGTFMGEPLPSSTYWFTLELPDRPIVRGYFALKR
ncbi:hypothetical protein NMS_1100 [Nonlabens marinus S1-08]|uniref:T9SS type B sorting domain-containing protein n=2 Tax=Nonlabens TaxID=363408 RepID=W8VPL1_9FLAO|nr:hypothetical protein NMS_1100 [Nonlabens marinus S1-08]